MKKALCNKRNGCSHWDKHPNHQRRSAGDLLIACHSKWKGLPWLHGALTPVCLSILHIPDFYNLLLHSLTPETDTTISTSHKEKCARQFYVYKFVINSINHGTYRLPKHWSSVAMVISPGKMISWVLAHHDVYGKQLQAEIRYWWKQLRVIIKCITIYLPQHCQCLDGFLTLPSAQQQGGSM